MLVYGMFGGIGGALLKTPAVASVGHFFDLRRALVTGIVNKSGSVGGIVIPLLLQGTIDKIGFACQLAFSDSIYCTRNSYQFDYPDTCRAKYKIPEPMAGLKKRF
jgi:hypothetical protein